MSRIESVHDRSREELLREAVARRTPLALSCRVADGWSGFNSKFLAESKEDRGLLIEYPWSDGSYVPELTEGQTLGLSFRRGARRCVFSSSLRAVRRLRMDAAEIPAILIEWPAEIIEWQRRLDYRAPAPANTRIPVTACLEEGAATAPAACFRGELIDISAGGMSMGFPFTDYPRWEVDEVIRSSFSPASDEPPLEVTGRVRYAQRARDSFRVGMQWYGLETTEPGRAVLDRVIDLCAAFQQVEIDRLAGMP